MRYIASGLLKENMILGKTLYAGNGNILLHAGAPLRKAYIESLIRMGYPGVYIEDKLSEDIELKEVVSPELKNEIIMKIKNMFTNIKDESEKTRQKNISSLTSLIGDIVMQIVDNKNIQLNLIDLKTYDDYTYMHSVNVSIVSLVLGAALELNAKTLNSLGMASVLHDIGKMFIPKEILDKPGKLTRAEFEEIKKHTTLGYNYLKTRCELSNGTCLGALTHHEKYAGDGYPNKLLGDDICQAGKIIAIADVYDAISSKRSYHDSVLPSEAAEYIMANAGIHFDPRLVAVFLKKVAIYPMGMSVLLSNGVTGLVAENFEDFIMRPLIKVVRNGAATGEFLDLKNDISLSNVTIVKVNVDLDSWRKFNINGREEDAGK